AAMYPNYSLYGGQPQSQQQPPPAYEVGAVACGGGSGLDSLLAQLKRMDKEELQKLLDSDDKVAEMTSGSGELQQLGQAKQAAMAANRQMAELNFALGPRIEESRRRLAALSDEADAQRAVFLETRSRLESLNSAASPDTLLTLLEAACMEADEQAESLAEALATGGLDMAGFVRQYSEARQLYHLRRAKVDWLAKETH
ncbi:hypothetical protein BOX15_Mlig020610g1, partial [Macrostomum lignano]